MEFQDKLSNALLELLPPDIRLQIDPDGDAVKVDINRNRRTKAQAAINELIRGTIDKENSLVMPEDYTFGELKARDHALRGLYTAFGLNEGKNTPTNKEEEKSDE